MATGRSTLHFGSRGKRRSRSQRIGKQGQLVFESWALKLGLVANGCPEDYGVDYFCQEMQPLAGDRGETTGVVLAVQVRSVGGGSRPRITLDKVDAETALRLECPYVLVGVRVETEEVSFRFMDRAFASELADFVSSANATTSFRVDKPAFHSAGFLDKLFAVGRPGVQQALRMHCLRLCMQRDIPGAQLSVQVNESGTFALLEAQWVASLFRPGPGQESALARMVFEEGRLPTSHTQGFSLHESVFAAMEVAGSDTLLVRGTFEREAEGSISHGDLVRPLALKIRRVGDEMALITQFGLVLTTSDRREEEGREPYHATRLAFSREFGLTLDQLSEYEPAIRLFKPGATIRMSPDGNPMPVEMWGPALECLGEEFARVIQALQFARIPLKRFMLADLADEEFAHATGMLDAARIGRSFDTLVPGFVLGPAANDPQFRSNLVPARYRVPVVFNLREFGIVLWFEGRGQASVYEQMICGMLPEASSSIQVEVRARRYATTSHSPEAWFCKEWPPIPLASMRGEDEWEWTGGTHSHEIEAEIYFDD